MLRKTLTLGMVFILAISLLSASMITCFTYEAEAHPPRCWVSITCELDANGDLINCVFDVWCEHEPHDPTGD